MIVIVAVIPKPQNGTLHDYYAKAAVVASSRKMTLLFVSSAVLQDKETRTSISEKTETLVQVSAKPAVLGGL